MTRAAQVFGRLLIVCGAVLCLGLVMPSGAQAKRELRGIVYLLGPQDELQPVTNTDVWVEETGDRDVTTAAGSFRFHLPDLFRPGDTVTLHIKMEDYQILYPYGGRVRIPAAPRKDLVRLRLDKKGSHRFMNHEAFALLMEQVANESKEQVKTEDGPQEVDLGRYLKDWAVKYGFGIEEVRAELDKWAAEIEATSDDFYKLGLAAFYKKNFGEAAEKFTRSAQEHERQLAEVREQEAELTEKVIRDYRLAGDAQYNDYRFQDAIQSYRKALRLTSRDTLPQQWATTQNNLGIALGDQGIRTGGEAGAALLAQAVDAYRAALTVRTPDTLPQDWAMTQNNLGNALRDQALQSTGEAKSQLLEKAAAALRRALEVRTYEHLPYDWAQTQNNLAETYEAMQAWKKAADCYVNALRVYPGYRTAYAKASFMYHELVFAFDKAFELASWWVEQQHNTDLASRSNFIEKHFTTGRFAQTDSLLSKLLPELTPENDAYVPLVAIDIANLLALWNPDSVPAKLNTLIAALEQQPDDYHMEWNFNGTKHFIETADALTQHRDWLLALFRALEDDNRQDVLGGLAEAKRHFVPGP
jgi:tetratricopeptide (TPR) repeat protein